MNIDQLKLGCSLFMDSATQDIPEIPIFALLPDSIRGRIHCQSTIQKLVQNGSSFKCPLTNHQIDIRDCIDASIMMKIFIAQAIKDNLDDKLSDEFREFIIIKSKPPCQYLKEAKKALEDYNAGNRQNMSNPQIKQLEALGIKSPNIQIVEQYIDGREVLDDMMDCEDDTFASAADSHQFHALDYRCCQPPIGAASFQLPDGSSQPDQKDMDIQDPNQYAEEKVLIDEYYQRDTSTSRAEFHGFNCLCCQDKLRIVGPDQQNAIIQDQHRFVGFQFTARGSQQYTNYPNNNRELDECDTLRSNRGFGA